MTTHDRHGRLARADGDPRRRPADGFRAADGRRFAALVRGAVAGLPADLRDHAAGVAVRVVDVPDPDDPDVVDGLGGVRLAVLQLPRPGASGRLIVHRRPVESRAGSRADLVAVLGLAIRRAVQDALGLPPDPDD